MATVSIADLVIPQEQVAIPGSEDTFAVGALSFKDIVALFSQNKEILGELFNKFQGQSDSDNKKMVQSVLGTLINDAPEIAGQIISLAAGAGFSASEKLMRLPFPTQTEALQKIARLTFGRLEDDAVKKFFTTIADALQVINATITEAAQALPAGSVKSDGT